MKCIMDTTKFCAIQYFFGEKKYTGTVVKKTTLNGGIDSSAIMPVLSVDSTIYTQVLDFGVISKTMYVTIGETVWQWFVIWLPYSKFWCTVFGNVHFIIYWKHIFLFENVNTVFCCIYYGVYTVAFETYSTSERVDLAVVHL